MDRSRAVLACACQLQLIAVVMDCIRVNAGVNSRRLGREYSPPVRGTTLRRSGELLSDPDRE